MVRLASPAPLALALSLVLLAPAAAQEVALTTASAPDPDAMEGLIEQLARLKQVEALLGDSATINGSQSNLRISKLRAAILERSEVVVVSGTIDQMPLPDALLAVAEHAASAGARITLAMSQTDREALTGLVVTVRLSRASVEQALQAIVAPYGTGEHGLVVELEEDDGVYVVRAIAADEDEREDEDEDERDDDMDRDDDERDDDERDDDDRDEDERDDDDRDEDERDEEMDGSEDRDDDEGRRDADDEESMVDGEDDPADRDDARADSQPDASGAPGFLGVSFEPAGDGQIGVRLTEVVEGSPAAEAGLRAGDRVIHLNGRPFEDLRRLIQARKAGQSVRLTVMSADGTLRQMHVTLGEVPSDD